MDYIKAIENYKQLQGHKALQLRAVLFDMDGVLFDSMPYHADAWSKVMTDAGFNFTREDVYMNEGRTGADTINTASMAQFGKPATQELIDHLCKEKCKIFDTYPPTPRMAGAIELVKKVKACGLTPMIVLRCFLFNGGMGLIFGRAYRKHGIHYAMLSHIFAHVGMKLISAIIILM